MIQAVLVEENDENNKESYVTFTASIRGMEGKLGQKFPLSHFGLTGEESKEEIEGWLDHAWTEWVLENIQGGWSNKGDL